MQFAMATCSNHSQSRFISPTSFALALAWLLFLPAYARAQDPTIQPVSPFAVHAPAHVTIIPERVSHEGSAQIPSMLLGMPADSAKEHVQPGSPSGGHEHASMDRDKAVSPAAHALGNTRMATQTALDALFSWHLSTLQSVQGLAEVSNGLSSALQQQQQDIEQLHEQVASAANEEALLAAHLIDDLSTLTADKVVAVQSLDLHTAAEITAKMTRTWKQLEGAHARETMALTDADALAEAILGLQAAQAEEQQELATCLQLVASEVQGVADQLSSYASGLLQVARQEAQQRRHMQDKVQELGTAVAVRRWLAQLSGAALGVLTRAGQQLAHARSHFQDVWRQALASHHQESMRAALSASAEAELQDLAWRRDMALAVDAYSEAQATQTVLDRLHKLQEALSAEASLPRGSHEETAAQGSSTHEIGDGQGHKGVAPTSDLRHTLVQALQEYRTHLAAQRDASTTLAQLELLRQQLVLGQATPAQVLSQLQDLQLIT